MRGASKAVLILMAAVLLPSLAFHRNLTGTVRDESGGVLPGVTVEASSPALIEKVRTALTDGAGQYRITGLNPGTYSLTFRLSGFNIVKREGIELSGTATLTIPVEMRVGALAETITVTGETPVVDVQTTQRETVLSADVVAAMPGNRSVGTLLNAVPGLTVNDGALAASPTMTFFAARGGPINEGRMTINGMTIAAPFNGGGVSTYILDSVNVDEVAVSVAGGLGESDIGGPVMNLVPRSGGNNFRGQGFFNNAGNWSRGDNLTDELRAVGLSEVPGIINSYDASISYGGPIKRDRLWFFGSYRSLDTASAVQGVVANKNAYDASRWDWVADPSVPARQAQGRESFVGRFTAQVSSKHRVSFNEEYQRRCEGSPLKAETTEGCNTRGADWVAAGTATASPEANPNYFGNTPYHVHQGLWTAPMTSRLLLEAGFTYFSFRGGTTGRVPPDGIFDLISVTEQSTAINPATGLQYAPRANFAYRGVATANPNYANPNSWRASASYVTGSHDLKVGYQGQYIIVDWWDLIPDSQVSYRFNQGVPNQFTFRLPEWHRADRTSTAALYIQDRWTRGRLTLQGALRYDRASSFSPAEFNGTDLTSKFNAAPITFERTAGVDAFNDITPRFGAAWDVFGTGRTALKFNLGHYLDAATNDSEYTSNSPAVRIVRTAARNWGDTNNNKVVDCDIMNFAQNGECAALTGDALNFGTVSGNLAQVNQATLRGWGVRQHDWQWGITVQQQVIPRVSAEVAYNRRWFHGEKVTDNTLRGPGDYEPFTILAPQDPRLPGGGGYPIALSMVTPGGGQSRRAELRHVRNGLRPGAHLVLAGRRFHVERASPPGSDAAVRDADRPVESGRLRDRTGERRDVRGRSREHDIDEPGDDQGPAQLPRRRSVPDDRPGTGVVHDSKGRCAHQRHGALAAGARARRHLAGAEHGDPGHRRTAAAGRSRHWQLHRRNPGQRPSAIRRHRRTQIDMRFAKIFRFGKRRVDVGVDLGNLLNTNYTTTYENTYQYSVGNTATGGTWNNPTAIYTPRFVRWNLTVDF